MSLAVHPLHLADVTYPEGHPEAGKTGPVYAFAIAGPAGFVLVDTGIGPEHPAIDEAYRPQRYNLVEALRTAGCNGKPEAIILSHLHFDHCGQAAGFEGLPLYVQRAEREAAKQPGYTIPERVDFPDANYVLLDGEHEACEGVRIIPTPGHTPGHQSVVVDAEEGTVVIAAQAAQDLDAWQLYLSGDHRAFSGEEAASLGRLAAIGPTAVYFSHDGRRG